MNIKITGGIPTYEDEGDEPNDLDGVIIECPFCGARFLISIFTSLSVRCVACDNVIWIQ